MTPPEEAFDLGVKMVFAHAGAEFAKANRQKDIRGIGNWQALMLAMMQAFPELLDDAKTEDAIHG